MTSTRKRPDPLPPDALTATIRQCISEGAVVPFPHFRGRAFQRRFTLQDAINVLQHGAVASEAPQWDEKSGMWTYLIHGPDLEGDILTVVIRVSSIRGQIWLVTAY